MEIPTPDDFRQSGIAFLNLAWDSASQLHFYFDDAKAAIWDEDEDVVEKEVTDEYWAAAQRSLATAVTLVQQGLEFLLKGRIAEISPFFLLATSPSEWPKGSGNRDTNFAEFKTIDAQDLVRVHNTVALNRLPEEIVSRFSTLRRQRNTIMHTVDRQMRFTAIDIFRDILEISNVLIGKRAWVAQRRRFLESGPESIAYSPDHVDIVMVRDFRRLIDALTGAELKRFFGFEKKQRRYLCPHCQLTCRDYYEDARSAQLRPNLPTSTTVYCFICENISTVIRENCTNKDCKGNVLEADERTCLSCSTNEP